MAAFSRAMQTMETELHFCQTFRNMFEMWWLLISAQFILIPDYELSNGNIMYRIGNKCILYYRKRWLIGSCKTIILNILPVKYELDNPFSYCLSEGWTHFIKLKNYIQPFIYQFDHLVAKENAKHQVGEACFSNVYWNWKNDIVKPGLDREAG